MSDRVLLRCKMCGQVNRVDTAKFHLKPKCHSCQLALTFSQKPVDIVQSQYQKEVLNDPGLVLLDFWAPSCGHCLNLNPILDEIAHDYAGKLKVVKVNTQVESRLAGQFGISGIPTLFLFNNGKKIKQISGALPKMQLLNWIYT